MIIKDSIEYKQGEECQIPEHLSIRKLLKHTRVAIHLMVRR